MIKYLNLFVIVLLVTASCAKKEKETPNGMKYQVLKSGDGTLPQKNQVIAFDYLLKDNKDSVWTNTYTDGVPAASMVADSSRIAEEDGMTQMFRMLSVGDSVTTSMTVGEFFRKLIRRPVPMGVDSSRTVTYTVSIREIFNTPEEYYNKRAVQVDQRDDKKIVKFLTDNKITAQKDTSGLQFVIHNSEGGTKPTVNNCVVVKYEGRFMNNGQIFDRAERVAFPLLGVIQGWQLGIPLLGVGDSGTFYIPSRLAYGPRGYPGAIPPDAILMFDVKLIEVKNEFDQETRSCK